MKTLLCALLILTACKAPVERTDGTATAPAPVTTAPVQETASVDETAPADATIVEETTAPPSKPPAPTPAADREIYIDGVQVANPIVIAGRARTFENNVVLRARDARGALLVEGFTTSDGEMGRHNPYRGSLWLTRDPGNRITVEALEYSTKDGSERSLVRMEKPFAVETVEARLYFPDQSCTGVKPYTRRIPKSISMIRLLVEALMAGPAADERKRGAAVPFPKGSEVRSVNLRDGVAIVDFNERLQNVGGSCQAQMIRAAVTETLNALPAVRSVKITAGGSEALALQP
ncbi:MAG TPA: GerMN domain-containing protein [Thermoanaerobaculia bacterium]|nr:GerMN domain-containing protein [Thermoanaerobaculia bacterium]